MGCGWLFIVRDGKWPLELVERDTGMWWGETALAMYVKRNIETRSRKRVVLGKQ